MMGRFLLIATLFVLAGPILFGQKLKIYHLGMGQGDCTLIIASDSTTGGHYTTLSVLIDTGPGRSAGKVATLWEFVKSRLKADGAEGLDYFVISHLHSDHMYGAPKLLEKIYEEDPIWINEMSIVDRIGLDSKWGLAADDCWDYEPSGIIESYNNVVTSKFPRNRIPVLFGADLFKTAGFKNIGMLCVASNGMVNGVSYALPKSSGSSLPKSENDLSFAFLLQFQGFRYFTGGDVGGGSPYSDIETPIVNYLKTLSVTDFHFCCFKVSHHGSTHSTNAAFLNYTTPTYGVIQSALRSFQGTKLPTKPTLDALLNTGTITYFTFTPSGVNYYSGDATAYRDVIIEVSAPPGYGKNIDMVKTTYLRNRTTLAISSGSTVETITCTKPHN